MAQILNDKYAKQQYEWSSKRSNEKRLRHRPHVVNTAENRNNKNVRYYSSVDADIYFGGQFIDEVVSITWQVQQNTMPLFGYNSFTFDDIALGTRIITGQLLVNYTESNYLTKVMNVLNRISRKSYGEDTVTKSNFTDADMKRRNTPIWDAGFDIMVGFGEKTNESYESVIVLDCCQITGCSQQLDYNGEPAMEAYSFIARDMKFSKVATLEQSVENDTLEDEYNNDIETSTPIDRYEELIPGVAYMYLNGSSSIASLEIEPMKELLGAHLFVKGVDNVVFCLGIEATLHGDSIKFELSQEQKKTILKYVSKNGTKIQGDVRYYLPDKSDQHQIVEKFATIIFEALC